MADLNNPEYFINREISWLRFNLRVLREGGRKKLPLLERLKFIAIAASNLDEFFMVRVAGLYNQLENGINKKDAAGLTVAEQLRHVAKAAHMQMKAEYSYLFSILKELRKKEIIICRVNDVEPAGKEWLEEYYREIIYPVLTPMAVDASRPFPFLVNRSLNLALELINRDGQLSRGFVQVPSVLPRIIEVGSTSKRTFVFLEEVILTHCGDLFTGCELLDVVPFRITRDADLEVDEEDTDDLLKEIELSLRKRKRGAAVRLEIVKARNQSIKQFLAESLSLEEQAIYEVNGPLDATCFFKFIKLLHRPEWEFAPIMPQPPLELQESDCLFQTIDEDDVLLHHPYESFEPVVRLISDAATDPNVLAIKQTLYRVSGNSPLVSALARAAENGKQVTVLVELKARFDEENNIIWARRLEKAGCHVIYGLVGLKTHAKIILIVRREPDGIRRYVHLGTGNYNDNTARLYTDLGLLTANDQFGIDASAFFNLLSGYADPPVWNKLVMAPLGLRKKLCELIDAEIAQARRGGIGHIIVKMNSLIDKGMIQKLYEASMAGVNIELIIRGICGLRPGLAGISENITVRSIIGRLLEHSRVFYFGGGGKEQVFLSSADWMPRNLNDRVELFFPVESRRHVERIREILALALKDNVGAHIMQSNGIYRRSIQHGEPVCMQETLQAMAEVGAKKEKLSVERRLKPLYRKDERL